MNKTVSLRATWKYLEELDRVAQSMARLTTGDGLGELIRSVLAVTILKHMRERYADSAVRIMDMQRVLGLGSLEQELRLRQIRTLEARISNLPLARQGTEEHSGLKAELSAVWSDFNRNDPEGKQDTKSSSKVFAGGDHHGETELNTMASAHGRKGSKRELVGKGSLKVKDGLFEKLMNDVMDILATPKFVVIQRTATRMVIGIGDENKLNRIWTPSYSQPSMSPHGTLWRHMEFGTGVFAAYKPLLGHKVVATDFKEADGTWHYGHKEGISGRWSGLHFLGSRPGNIILDERGAPFPDDKMLFEAHLHLALNRALLGRA